MGFARVSRTAATISEVKQAQKFKREVLFYNKAGRPLKKGTVMAVSLCATAILTVTSVILASGFYVSQAEAQYAPEPAYSFDIHVASIVQPRSQPPAEAEAETPMAVAARYEAPIHRLSRNTAGQINFNQLDIETFVLDAYYEALLEPEYAQLRSYREGEASWQISALQARLAVLGYGASVTGVFDAATVGAVTHFQTLNNLKVTGRIGTIDEEAILSETPVHADGVAHNIEDTIYNADFSAELFIDTALQFLGVRYRWGGKSPATGFDCSGFVYYNLNRSGFEIAYMTDRGWFATTQFNIISEKSDVQPGDILIFRGHVGIYIGGGLMIDASFSTGRVRITDIDQNFWRGIWHGARRLV
jgi:cell wall-associated NlpC family hydrolase